ncbi:hypothetical protein [Natronobiforma cellulositropha]|uniref:hypothetical protein n=1 Tax=Natronobiforma cellulositropha TaxID=1679076 RepID=UPI0021D5E8F4|nr:hypothetical protein [Natronobiforma cellulositropha]
MATTTLNERLTIIGVAVTTLVATNVLSGGGVSAATIGGVLAATVLIALLEYDEGALEKRAGIAGALVLSSVFVAVALWLSVTG